MKNPVLVTIIAGLSCLAFIDLGEAAVGRTNVVSVTPPKFSTHSSAAVRTNLRTAVADSRLGTARITNVTAARTLPLIAKSNLVSPVLRHSDVTMLKAFIRDETAWRTIETQSGTGDHGVRPQVPANVVTLIASPLTNRMLLKQGDVRLRFAMSTPASESEPYEVFDLESYATPNPARWNADKELFETELRVAVFRTNRNSRAKPISPVVFDFAGVQMEARPAQLVFTNVGDFQTLQVTFARNDVEARIDIFPLTDGAPLVVPARWLRHVTLAVSPRSILGLGLGTATVTIKRTDQNGMDLDEGPELTIDVAAEFATVEPTLVIAKGKSRAQFQLRSVGTKAERISASAGDLSTIATVEVRPIWLYLTAVVAGGLVGGCVRIFNFKRQPRNVSRILLEGCVVGLLAAAAVSAGVALTVLPASVANSELGVFMISAGVGITGTAAVYGLKNLVPQFPTTPAK